MLRPPFLAIPKTKSVGLCSQSDASAVGRALSETVGLSTPTRRFLLSAPGNGHAQQGGLQWRRRWTYWNHGRRGREGPARGGAAEIDAETLTIQKSPRASRRVESTCTPLAGSLRWGYAGPSTALPDSVSITLQSSNEPGRACGIDSTRGRVPSTFSRCGAAYSHDDGPSRCDLGLKYPVLRVSDRRCSSVDPSVRLPNAETGRLPELVEGGVSLGRVDRCAPCILQADRMRPRPGSGPRSLVPSAPWSCNLHCSRSSTRLELRQFLVRRGRIDEIGQSPNSRGRCTSSIARTWNPGALGPERQSTGLVTSLRLAGGRANCWLVHAGGARCVRCRPGATDNSMHPSHPSLACARHAATRLVRHILQHTANTV